MSLIPLRPARCRQLLSVLLGAACLLHLVVLCDALVAGPLPATPASGAAMAAPVAALPLDGATAEVFFSPRGGCTEAIVNALGQAQHSVDVLAYGFTSQPIAAALVAASKRGVAVRVVLDRSNASATHSQAAVVAGAGIPTYLDSMHQIAHNKVLLIDGTTVLTGSFNFTTEAEAHNAENLLVLHHCPALAATYAANFQVHLAHSTAYRARAG